LLLRLSLADTRQAFLISSRIHRKDTSSYRISPPAAT